MGFRLQQKLVTFNDLERQFIDLSSDLCVFWPNRLKLESRSFRYKVALYLSSVHIKFDDEIEGNPFECQAYFPIRLRLMLNWRLGLALFAARFCSNWDL